MPQPPWQQFAEGGVLLGPEETGSSRNPYLSIWHLKVDSAWTMPIGKGRQLLCRAGRDLASDDVSTLDLAARAELGIGPEQVELGRQPLPATAISTVSQKEIVLVDDHYGDNNHSFTYEEKLDEVYQWRNGVFDRRRDGTKRIPLNAGDLEQLGRPPSQGGLVERWRLMPSFFGAAAKRTVVSPSRAPLRASNLETGASASRLVLRREGRGRAKPVAVAVP